MNRISPKTLIHSKWTKMNVVNKEKHFAIIKVTFDEDKNVIECIIQAVISNNEYAINWRDLKDSKMWKLGWK